MFKDFFNENNKEHSLIRLTTFILVSTAVVLSILCPLFVLLGKSVVDLIYLIAVLLGFALGSKVVQKFSEKETNIN